MKPWKLFLALLVFLLRLAEANQNSQMLLKVQDRYWGHLISKSLYLQLTLGHPIDELPDSSVQEVNADSEFYQSVLDELEKIDVRQLNHEESLNYEIIQWESRNNVEFAQFYRLSFLVTPYASPIPLALRVFSEFRFESAGDLQRYLSLLAKYPAFIRHIHDHTAGQKKDGILIPKDELKLVAGFLNSLIQNDETSPFAVKDARLSSISPASAVSDFKKAVAGRIESEVNPALKQLMDLLSGEYEANAPQAVGLGQYPGGAEYYNFLVRYHTTMNVTPEEVHQTGLKHVAYLNSQMDRIRKSLDFKGTKTEFHAFLKSDARFIPKTPAQIGENMMSFVKRIETKVDSYFHRKPKAPYGVERLDPKLEGSMTFGYYRQPTPTEPTGVYFYNGSNPSERPMFNSGSVIYHELVPGHHFQISLQAENEQLPMFRKYSGHTAFIEGWAEYASGLAGEMGMYRDPYEEYGRLAGEMFLTVRLVVDTGMNALGWTRAKAMEYMKENLLESETQIKTESLRYSCDIPGQALAYKMGSLKIVELREKARAALGDRFDIRKFHDLVLGGGSVPMTILERQVDRFVAQEK